VKDEELRDKNKYGQVNSKQQPGQTEDRMGMGRRGQVESSEVGGVGSGVSEVE
jgi:hypothetical protein